MSHTAEFRIDADHPCLPGHFPGHPLVPGAVILDRVVEAAQSWLPDHRVMEVRQVKFVAPLQADQTVTVHLQETNDAQLRFRCQRAGSTIASGILRLAPAAR